MFILNLRIQSLRMNNDMEKGETMFEFLKRKKRQMLEQTLSRYKPHHESQQFYTGRDKENDGDYQQTKRIDSRQKPPKPILKPSRNVQSESVTPKRVSILEEEKRPATRSFLQMISPIRSKSPIQKETEKIASLSPRQGKKDNFKDNFTKKMMLQKMGNMRQLVESFIQSASSLKQKSHFLFVELKPFFRHLQSCAESKFERKTEVIRAKLKGLQQIFSEFSVEPAHQIIDSFYLNFSQYINEFEGLSRAEMQSNKDSAVSEVVKAKQMQIDELQESNRKLERQLQNYIKKYERLQQNYNALDEKTFEEIQAEKSQRIFKQQQYEHKIRQLMKQRSSIREALQEATSALKQKQMQIKKMRYEQQQYKQECFKTINKVKSEQQEFLLNEIMVLKKQFNADITEITRLHQIKEQEYQARIEAHTNEIDKMKQKMGHLVQENLEAEEAVKQGQAQAIRFKKQNEILATDMHRINQELYQHWLALKDIKTLAMRLDIFHKFKKIYEELLFNEQLFL